MGSLAIQAKTGRKENQELGRRETEGIQVLLETKVEEEIKDQQVIKAIKVRIPGR